VLTGRWYQLETFFKQMEQEMVAKEKEIERLKADVFRQSQELFKERQDEANFMMEITGAQAAAKNLHLQITRHGPLSCSLLMGCSRD
jgi:hypothetical protein